MDDTMTMDVDILDPITALLQDEILEHVFKQMDSNSLLKLRSVSKQWNAEINKILKKRRYGNLLSISEWIDKFRLKVIIKLLKSGGFISPSTLIGNLQINASVINDISDNKYSDYELLLNNYGSFIHQLKLQVEFYEYEDDDAKFNGMDQEYQDKVIEILNKCQNVETLHLLFGLYEKRKTLPSNSHPFSIMDHKELSKLNYSFSTDMDEGWTDNPGEKTTSLLRTFEFYLDILKKTIISTEKLEYLSIHDEQDWSWKRILTVLTEPDVASKFSYIKHLILCDEHLDLEYEQSEEGSAELYKFLKTMSNSVETLSISGRVPEFGHPSCPKMRKLKTLFVENDPHFEIDSLKLVDEFLPCLETVVIGDYKEIGDIADYPNMLFDWDFKWPFRVTRGGWSSRLKWQDTVKQLAMMRGKGVAPHELQVNVVIYLTRESEDPADESEDDESSWDEILFKGISKLNVGSLFIHLHHHDECTKSIQDWKDLFLAKFGHVPYLQHCVIHDNRGNRVGEEGNQQPKTYQFIRQGNEWEFVEMV